MTKSMGPTQEQTPPNPAQVEMRTFLRSRWWRKYLADFLLPSYRHLVESEDTELRPMRQAWLTGRRYELRRVIEDPYRVAQWPSPLQAMWDLPKGTRPSPSSPTSEAEEAPMPVPLGGIFGQSRDSFIVE